MIDDYEPALMFTIPRLAIVWCVFLSKETALFSPTANTHINGDFLSFGVWLTLRASPFQRPGGILRGTYRPEPQARGHVRALPALPLPAEKDPV